MDELTAGPELDRRIAADVLRWTYHKDTADDGFRRLEWQAPDGYWHPLFAFSTDLAAAWEVVPALQAQGWHLAQLAEGYRGDWVATFARCSLPPPDGLWWYDPDVAHKARGATPALALCGAALMAVERQPA